MKRFTGVLLVVAVMASGACYHATVDTGLTPGPDKVENTFASSWIYGLVPPKTVETAAKCPRGVARIETQLSFVNGLVGMLTLGIYTPMNIVVTCAQSGSTASVSEVAAVDRTASLEVQREVVTQTLKKAGVGQSVFVVFE
jgi:hypothetical protein